MGVTFHSTLFDENASCHLALGQAYRFSLQGAESLSDEAFAQVGRQLEQGSLRFHDRFCGPGRRRHPAGRSSETVIRKGEWAFTV